MDITGKITYTHTSPIYQAPSHIFYRNECDGGYLFDYSGKNIAIYNDYSIVQASDTRVILQKNAKVWIGDVFGNIWPDSYTSAWLFDNGNALVCSDNIWYYLDTLLGGKFILEVSYVIPLYNNSCYVVSTGDLYGVINNKGALIAKIQYNHVEMKDNQIVAYKENGNDIIAFDGQVLYSSMGISSNTIVNNSQVLYYDPGIEMIYNGIKIHVPQNVVWSTPLYDGIACVLLDTRKWTYMDSAGNIMTDMSWDYVYRFSNGLALTKDVDINGNTTWFIINQQFQIVKTLVYDVYFNTAYPASADFSDGYIRTVDRKSGLMGFIKLDKYVFAGVQVGDVDLNGKVNMLDGIAVMKYYMKWEGYTEPKYNFSLAVADVDRNGYVNMIDGIAIMKHYLQWSGFENLPLN